MFTVSRTGADLKLDVTDPDAPERIAQECAERLGPLDVLVNNAGTSEVKPLEELTDADWQRQWELHVMAPMRLMRAVAPGMADRGGGRIVNVCSSSGKRPSLTNAAYSVTKAAQLSLSRTFADAYAAKGVLVNAVAPGPVDTGLWLGEGGLADQQAAAQGDLPRRGAGGPGREDPPGTVRHRGRGGGDRRGAVLRGRRQRGRRGLVRGRRRGPGDHLALSSKPG